jgi:hypothetical protein
MHHQQEGAPVDDDATPSWATGPDCFESEAHRKDVESERWHAADETVSAYELGNLHTLANSIEEFQAHHRLLFKKELDGLHGQLLAVINRFDAGSYSPDFPLSRKARHGHSA